MYVPWLATSSVDSKTQRPLRGLICLLQWSRGGELASARDVRLSLNRSLDRSLDCSLDRSSALDGRVVSRLWLTEVGTRRFRGVRKGNKSREKRC